jgi:TolB-like protein
VNKRSIAVALLSLAVLGVAYSQALRISIMDFDVVSENPQYKSLGKGFTELTSVQVSKLPGVILVDRAKRNDLLEEQAFAISDAADAGKSIALGKLLSVDYLIAGSVVDMLGELVVSYEVIRTDTGVVVGKDQASGAASDYKRIVRDIGTGIGKLTGKTLAAAKAAVAPPAKAAPPEKQVVVLQSFAEAVDAIDNKDVKTAEAKLNEAKAIDPANEAVGLFLAKLAKGTSKFVILPSPQYSLDNPANLALLEKDSSFLYAAFGSPSYLTGKSLKEAWVPLAKQYGGKDYYLDEQDIRTMLGYSAPIGRKAGIGAQVFYNSSVQTIRVSTNPPDINSANIASWPIGAVLSMGYSLTPWLSIGLGFHAGQSVDSDPGAPDRGFTFYGGELGLLFKNPEGNLMLSLLTAYSTLSSYQFDMSIPAVGARLPPTLHIDITGTVGFNQSRDFAVLKYVCDTLYGWGSYPPFLQFIPAYEHWFGSKLSLRLGGVLTMVPQQTFYLGYGGTLGATMVFGSWEIDLGATLRNRTSYTISTEIVTEPVFNFCIRRNGLFAKR